LNLGQEKEAVQAMITLAKIAVAQGKLDCAREVIDKAATVARETSYGELTQGLLSVQGHIELRSENYQAAHSLLLRALEVTKEKNLGTHIGSRQIDLGNVALAQNQLSEAATYFDAGLKSSQQFLRQDNIAKAKLGLAQTLAFHGNNLEAKRWAIDAREQFMRMGMKPEVDKTDALLQQLEDSKEQSRGTIM
jgi:tetratricopeptide (TPR) repeat protein